MGGRTVGEPGQRPPGTDRPAAAHSGRGAILTTEAGYALAVDPGDMDAVRFERAGGQGRRLRRRATWSRRPPLLGEALRLRRGEPLAEFAYAGFADAERAHLDELTLVAFEARVGADLSLGRHGEVVGELEALCREHPLRERLWELLILALYRDGRQAEALRAYTEIRDRLVDELGIDPGVGPPRARGPCPGPGPDARRRAVRTPLRSARTDGSGQPARAVEQLRRAQCRARTAERDGCAPADS